MYVHLVNIWCYLCRLEIQNVSSCEFICQNKMILVLKNRIIVYHINMGKFLLLWRCLSLLIGKITVLPTHPTTWAKEAT